MAKKNQEVEKKAEAAVPATVSEETAWGSEGIDGGDLLVPKILLMQGLSKFVTEGVANVGQIRDSLEAKLLGGAVGPSQPPQELELLAFGSFKTWVLFEKQGKKDKYVGTVPYTPENQGWPLEEVVNGISVRRDKCLNFYVLLTKDIAEGFAFPHCLSFRRTSMSAGKKLATLAAKARVFNKPLAGSTFKLTVAIKENEEGKFFVWDLAGGRNSTEAELQEAKKWHEATKSRAVKVDDSDIRTEPDAPQASSQPATGASGAPDGMDY
jgi:hypothetical protein